MTTTLEAPLSVAPDGDLVLAAPAAAERPAPGLGAHVRGAALRLAGQVGPVLLAVAVLVGVWQLVYAAGVKPAYVLPSPGDVASSLRDSFDSGRLGHAVRLSTVRGLEGFALATLVATPLGLLVGRVRIARLALRPLLAGMMTLPSVAWVPASILWFGLSSRTVFAVVLLGSVPAIANGLVSALDGVPPVLLRAGRVLGARRLTLARSVLFPAALPGYLGGLRSGWAFAWHALMTAEVIAVSPRIGNGLGQLLEQSRTLSDISGVFAAMIAILVVGVAVDRLVFAPVESHVAARRGLTTS